MSVTQRDYSPGHDCRWQPEAFCFCKDRCANCYGAPGGPLRAAIYPELERKHEMDTIANPTLRDLALQARNHADSLGDAVGTTEFIAFGRGPEPDTGIPVGPPDQPIEGLVRETISYLERSVIALGRVNDRLGRQAKDAYDKQFGGTSDPLAQTWAHRR